MKRHPNVQPKTATDRAAAKAEAERRADRHFSHRADATRKIRAGFVYRESMRLMGEPFPKGAGKRRNPEPEPVSKPPAEAMSDLERLLAESLERER